MKERSVSEMGKKPRECHPNKLTRGKERLFCLLFFLGYNPNPSKTNFPGNPNDVTLANPSYPS